MLESIEKSIYVKHGTSSIKSRGSVNSKLTTAGHVFNAQKLAPAISIYFDIRIYRYSGRQRSFKTKSSFYYLVYRYLT